jgi:hypothetical protein
VHGVGGAAWDEVDIETGERVLSFVVACITKNDAITMTSQWFVI